MEQYDRGTITIHYDPTRTNSWYYCSVSLERREKRGLFSDEIVAEQKTKEFEISLNGPGKTKAIKKVQKYLHARNLEVRVLDVAEAE